MSIRLIVNADDYGYFPEVSRGIREAARVGAVTATGILANSPAFDAEVAELVSVPVLDLGVHLDLTHGRPLTDAMAEVLAPWGGAFPDKVALVRALYGGLIPVGAVREEWRAQIRRCQAAGLRLRFLNSHEHLHMLPRLLGSATDLAREHGIPFVRRVSSEFGWFGASALARDLALGAATLLAGPAPPGAPRFLGLGPSGRLSLDYLRRRLARLRDGGLYELMCHPGHPPAAAEPRLRGYHDWEGEWRVLTSPELREVYAGLGIELTGYPDAAAPG